MEINEQTNIQPEQYNQFMPKTKFNIPKSTIQKVKSTITSLNSGLVSKDNFSTSASTPFTFVINPNNQTVIDLSQCYFNVAGTLKVPADYGVFLTSDIYLGNLFLSSLFQQATLSIGGTTIAVNANPGIDANLQAALKFDAYDLIEKNLADRQFMLNHLNPLFKPDNAAAGKIVFAAGAFSLRKASATQAYGATVAPIPALKNLTLVYNDSTGTVTVSEHIKTVKNMEIVFDDAGNGVIIVNNATVENFAGNEASTFTNQFKFTVYGQSDNSSNVTSSVIPIFTANPDATLPNDTKLIPFRCKFYLSDLFNYTVDSLDYIFNREISITLQRGSINSIIANVAGSNSKFNTTLDVSGITKFELVCFSYLLTDTAKQQLLAYYSRPVETLFGVQTTNLTPLYNTNANAEQNITLPLTVNFDTKCILLAFPKCSNALQPLSTGLNMEIVKQAKAPTGIQNANTSLQASWFGSNSNSYNFAGLKYIRISNTSNSNIYTYDFNGTAEQVYGPKPLLHGFDTNNADPEDDNHKISSILDYREAYSQYKQIRLLFGKDPDNGINYYDYLKDYCVIPIDLTGSNIPPNTRIFITFQFADWAAPYNPLYFGNCEGQHGQKQLTTNLLAVFLGSDVLQYNPDGTCLVKHILTTGSNEKTVNIK